MNNLAENIQVDAPPSRPPPVTFVNVRMEIDFGGQKVIAHDAIGIVRMGQDIGQLVSVLQDQNQLWFEQWWMSQHANTVKPQEE